jgi:hypothetical protein
MRANAELSGPKESLGDEKAVPQRRGRKLVYAEGTAKRLPVKDDECSITREGER